MRAIIVLLVVSAFFAGSETALTAVSRGKMHQLEKDGDRVIISPIQRAAPTDLES